MEPSQFAKRIALLTEKAINGIEFLLTEENIDIVVKRSFISNRLGKIIAAILFAIGAFLTSTGAGGIKAQLAADVLFRYGTVLWRV